MLRRAVVTQPAVRFSHETLDEISDQPRFADPSLAAEQHRLPFARRSLGPATRQRLGLARTTCQGKQAVARMQGVEAAFDPADALHCPSRDRPGDTLEVLRAKVLQVEQTAEQPARARRDHHRIRLGERLQPRGKVGRLAHHTALLGLSRPDEITDHDHAGGDAHPDLQRRAGRRHKPGHRVDEGEPRLHRMLGVVFARLRIAEIDQDAVAHVLGDETAVTLDRLGAASMIGADDGAQILRVQACRQRGRADQVAEHQGELAALGRICSRRRDWGVEFADCSQESAAISQDDAEILEVLVSQLVQDREVDPILGEARGILRHAEPIEPLINLGHRQQSIQYSGSARRKLRWMTR